MKKISSILLFCLFVVYAHSASEGKFLDPKDAKSPPQARLASYASSTIATNFLSGGYLGQHSYRPNESEKNGIVYTCKAGHIDIAHVRKIIDWTAFLAAKTFDNMMKNKTKFKFKSKTPSLYFVKLDYPEYWKVLPDKQKEKIAYYISARLGQYLAYTESIWHEILTWFGYKCIGFYPEFQSAFSWEDTFSNVLGSHIAVMALQDTEHEFDKAVTLALDRELKRLGIQSSHTAKRAAEQVRGLWFSGDLFFIDIKKRNLDIGLDDGFITPCIIAYPAECEGAAAQAYPVPNLAFLTKYGFSVRFEIEPREWEKNRILSIVYPKAKDRRKRLEPVIHFAPIMDYIKKEAVRKYGYDVKP